MDDSAQKIKQEKDRWQDRTLIPSLGDKALGKATTDAGIEVDVVYSPANLEGLDYMAEIGFPGEYPFTRGPYPSMYRGQLWTMRQYAGFGTAEESNARYKYLLAQGQTGLSVAFDLPTQLGYDSDDRLASEEVGKVGVAIDTLDDMQLLFQDIPLDRISTNFTINAPAAVILAMYIALGQKQGAPVKKLRGTLQNDILKEYHARKMYVFPPRPSLRLVSDTIEYCARELPRFNPISITGYHIREAGSNAVQELAFTMADAIVYVNDVLERGIGIDDFAPQLSFHFSCGRDVLEEIAKYRAARKLWAKITRERFGAKNPNSSRLRFFAGGSGVNLTAEEPFNNVVRATLQCLAGILGGAQSCHAMAYDEAHSIPTEESVKISLRTQQILAYESGVTKVADPLGGSYYIEYLTSALEQKAFELIRDIEAKGGMLRATENGDIQRAIVENAYQIEKAIDSGEQVVVGKNRFADQNQEIDIPVMELDPEIVHRQVARLHRVKQERDNDAVRHALEGLKVAASGAENLMPFILEAVTCRATVGEIMGVLREVFGTYREPEVL